MNISGIIPARYGAARFPGKPLVNIQGKSMIQRVYEQAQKAELDDVIVATDDRRIYKHIKDIGGFAVMTNPNHESGTSRVHEASINIKTDVVLNIQGDEPFLQPEQIDLIADSFRLFPDTQICTLIKRIDELAVLLDPNVVKVVADHNHHAVYFSRSPIPFMRDVPQKDWLDRHTFYKHIGIYGYKKKVLGELVRLPASPLETAESLEQLRWLQHGYPIRVIETEIESWSVDVPDDLKRLPESRS